MSENKTESDYNLRERKSRISEDHEAKLSNTVEVLNAAWSTKEVMDLTEGILTHGHFSDKILEKIPGKTWESYIKLYRQAANFVKARSEKCAPDFVLNVDDWIKHTDTICRNEKVNKGPLDIALLLKMLSMDGVLENHPEPKFTQGVDFGACYRLLHQAVLGHPLQPLNEPTMKLFSEVFSEITKEVDNDHELFEKIQQFCYNPEKMMDLPRMYGDKDEPSKPKVKSYTRKKPTTVGTPAPNSAIRFSTTPTPNPDAELIWKQLLESTSFNPLKFPQDFLKKTAK